MSYRVEIGSRADAQLAELDSAIGASVERKILWLAENAAVMIHGRPMERRGDDWRDGLTGNNPTVRRKA